MPDSLLMTCAAVILEAHGLQIRSLYSQNPVDAHNNLFFFQILSDVDCSKHIKQIIYVIPNQGY